MTNRKIVVISDLHIGGSVVEAGRGFRINTHMDELEAFVRDLHRRRRPDSVELVINGDFIDFLAEKRAEVPRWRASLDPCDTNDLEAARAIFSRDISFFRALGEFASHQRLTVLLGNHDVELSLPPIKKIFLEHLGPSAARGVRVIDDNSAYVVAGVLIEHGNRYDGWNVVDHDALRRWRSGLSRGERVLHGYEPPVGSRLVADVMNEIKSDYPFIDLLKPETSAALPLLLAFEPKYARKLAVLAPLAGLASGRQTSGTVPPKLTNVSAGGKPSGYERGAVDASVSGEDHKSERRNRSHIEAIEELLVPSNVQPMIPVAHANSVNRKLQQLAGVAALLLTPGGLGRRVPALRMALKALEDDRTFSLTSETEGAYFRAAELLARGPIRHVVFGHTHLAKHIQLGDERSYLNCGSWADLAEFPFATLRDSTDEEFESDVRGFLTSLRTSGRHKWVVWNPHCVQFSVDDNDALVEAPQLVPLAKGE